MPKHYALTLKWNTESNPTRLDYMQMISLLLLKHTTMVYNWAYESDSKNKLHLHAHIVCKYYHWKPYMQECNNRGFHINVQELKSIKDYQNWDNYLRKQGLNSIECTDINNINDIRQSVYPFQ